MTQAKSHDAGVASALVGASAGSERRAGPEGREDGLMWRNFYGRRKGKALRPQQVTNLKEILPGLEVPRDPGWRSGERMAPDVWFSNVTDVWLEIGFGSGEHLHHLALRNPEIGFVGCEPFVNGVAALLGKIAECDPGNIQVHPADVRYLLDRMQAEVFGRVYLLYPDPWPKARHRARRFVVPETLGVLARTMKRGAELRIATDIADYAEHAIASVRQTCMFDEIVTSGPELHDPWDGWVSTRYEAKALREGRRPHYLIWRRI